MSEFKVDDAVRVVINDSDEPYWDCMGYIDGIVVEVSDDQEFADLPYLVHFPSDKFGLRQWLPARAMEKIDE